MLHLGPGTPSACLWAKTASAQSVHAWTRPERIDKHTEPTISCLLVMFTGIQVFSVISLTGIAKRDRYSSAHYWQAGYPACTSLAFRARRVYIMTYRLVYLSTASPHPRGLQTHSPQKWHKQVGKAKPAATVVRLPTSPVCTHPPVTLVARSAAVPDAVQTIRLVQQSRSNNHRLQSIPSRLSPSDETHTSVPAVVCRLPPAEDTNTTMEGQHTTTPSSCA